MNILTVVDSFKGSLTSKQISTILKSHYEKLNHNIDTLAISDGGEGFLEAIEHVEHTTKIILETVGPLSAPLSAYYLLHQRTAYIELNQAVGINQIHEHELNPMKTSTYGLGVLIKDAIVNQHVSKIVLGIGGSATNDGGAGLLQALGVDFYRKGQLIKDHMNGYLIGKFDQLDTKVLNKLIKDVEFVIASDVDNPLLGKNGCCQVYAPQKGADAKMLHVLETNMKHYADQVETYTKTSVRDQDGAGAAGGVGFAALAFLNAKIQSGIQFMIEQLDIESYIKKADLIIVGEGKLDHQTAHGKAPLGVARLAKKYNKKVIAICAIHDEHKLDEYIDEVYAIVPKIATKEVSLSNPKESLNNLLETIKVTL
ncbi:glycerate kinase [Mycoplasmatota bacterium]|nr:glycerate kinase [Mycoplasmatota bacterium]